MMKKAVAFVLVTLLVLFNTLSLAENTIDFQSMSDIELVNLIGNAKDELARRNNVISEDAIGQGVYVVGRDIGSGTYTFTCLETGTYDDGKQRNAFYIYAIGEDGISQGKTLWYLYDAAMNGDVTVNLVDGTIFEIWNCSGFIKKINPSWKP